VGLLGSMSLADILCGKTIAPIIEKNFRETSNYIHKEFYEAFYPPIDVYEIEGGHIQVKADMGGFVDDDIKKITINNKILRIKAKRDPIEDSIKVDGKEKEIHMILTHRPLEIDAHIPLPLDIDDEDNPKILDGTDKYFIKNGVLTINISTDKHKDKHKDKNKST